MRNKQADEIDVLRLSLHGRLVGYLAALNNGQNVLIFADEFKADTNRPTFSLTTHADFPHSEKLMVEPWIGNQKLHPTLSNLLPEAVLREWIAQGLKVSIDDEFHMLSYLCKDLPGALIAEPVGPDEVPNSVLAAYGRAKAVKIRNASQQNKFSLAGVQMKFSMKEKDSRYHFCKANNLGDWIIKTPSIHQKDLPLNEFTAMTLASLAGVDIPEIKLVELHQLDNLPPINLPDEKLAFAIRRFDRDNGVRIHMEDFAQVLVKCPEEKYSSANYEKIGRILYQYSGDSLADAQQFARRLLVNILLCNGNAHLKNWSLLYSDRITPRLSPAYDIVNTSVYLEGERHYSLNLDKTGAWQEVSYANFKAWADRSGIPWRVIKPHLDDTMDKARSLWPEAIKHLPMNGAHKFKLRKHWGTLQDDIRV
ncbi:MAG: type II toxin-antitoxin system HipA family toxin [Gammaproteobacteria bacterium]|nr:type II toxin-antitoxin system HipA family toxin [Gammaproteobacteria bacterium]